MLLSHVPGYFKARRDALMKANSGAAFIFPSAEEANRNPDVGFPFRQESNFHYLGGFEEPDSALVLVPRGAKPGTHRTILFVRDRNVEKEMWEGERYGLDRAMSIFGADEAYLIADFATKLPELLRGCEKVFYRIGNAHWDNTVFGALETWRRSLGRSGKALPPVADPNEVIGEMRMFKSPEEIKLLRKACEITALGHKAAMKEVRPGMNEFEIEALVDYVFRKNGCKRLGYGSIVAGGQNAACLHYRDNNAPLNDKELLLIDAAGEYEYYTSDITRTFPIGKGFTEPQAQLYDLTLKAQLAGIAMAKPGATLPGIHKQVSEVLADGLLSLGLLKGKVDEVISTGALKRFYPHNTSHWLGIDVHDVGLYQKNGEPRPLEAGMSFTIEPGLYIQPGDQEIPEKYRKIGIRIEDDVVITATGCDVLSKDAPKLRADIEALK